MAAKYELTAADRAALPAWRDKWIAVAMSTEAMSPEECVIADKAVRGLYASANLPAPVAVVMAKGPISTAIAAGIAAGVWYLREHPEKRVQLCGRPMSDMDIMLAAKWACTRAVVCATQALETTVRVVAPPTVGAHTAQTARHTSGEMASASFTGMESAYPRDGLKTKTPLTHC